MSKKKNYCTVYGYEAPFPRSQIHKKTREIFKRLNKDGFVIYEYDDGPESYTVVNQIEDICRQIGLFHFDEHHVGFVIDTDNAETYNIVEPEIIRERKKK